MSIMKNNPLLKGASGMLGDVIVYRESRGKMIMANRPKKRALLTPSQEAAKESFLEAVQYGKKQVADPVSKADYATGIDKRRNSAYAVAVSDYLKVPEVKLIDTTSYVGVVGNAIAIKAVDDFRVVSVIVEIRNAADVVIEQGMATLNAGTVHHWTYLAQSANAMLAGSKITATATDKPGNYGSLQVIL